MWPTDADIERNRIRQADVEADAACAEHAIGIPLARMSQVGLTFRRAANEFHGAIARQPNDPFVGAWRESADWFDSVANDLLAAHNQTGLVKYK